MPSSTHCSTTPPRMPGQERNSGRRQVAAPTLSPSPPPLPASWSHVAPACPLLLLSQGRWSRTAPVSPPPSASARMRRATAGPPAASGTTAATTAPAPGGACSAPTTPAPPAGAPGASGPTGPPAASPAETACEPASGEAGATASGRGRNRTRSHTHRWSGQSLLGGVVALGCSSHRIPAPPPLSRVTFPASTPGAVAAASAKLGAFRKCQRHLCLSVAQWPGVPRATTHPLHVQCLCSPVLLVGFLFACLVRQRLSLLGCWPDPACCSHAPPPM